jgi:hypothetical protein
MWLRLPYGSFPFIINMVLSGCFGALEDTKSSDSLLRITAQQSRSQSVWPFTPKAFANFSPGLERSDNPGLTALLGINNAESVRKLANSFRVENASRYLPRVVAALQPWAEISERLRR